MKIQQLHQMYFSPTGTTKKVLEILAQEIGRNGQQIDLTLKQDVKYHFTANDVVVFGIPVYSGRVPRTAVERLTHLKGENTPVILVAAYGNRAYDDALLELKKLMEVRGFLVVAAVAAVCEHSIVPSIAAGRPDEADVKKIKEFAQQIMKKIDALQSWKEMPKLEVKGNPQFCEYKNVPLKPKASASCVKCGICAENCPAGAISKENPSLTDTSLCISCMRCVRNCPKQARSVSGIMQMAAKMMLQGKCKQRKEPELFV
ncbi:MAG: EFR1 family ferrodoxin [Lachnospiraceae bacterium]|jgi:ferredoxin